MEEDEILTRYFVERPSSAWSSIEQIIVAAGVDSPTPEIEANIKQRIQEHPDILAQTVSFLSDDFDTEEYEPPIKKAKAQEVTEVEPILASNEPQSGSEESQSAPEKSNPSLEESNPSLEESNPSSEESQSASEKSNPSLEESNLSSEESNPSSEESQSAPEKSQSASEKSNQSSEESNPSSEDPLSSLFSDDLDRLSGDGYHDGYQDPSFPGAGIAFKKPQRGQFDDSVDRVLLTDYQSPSKSLKDDLPTGSAVPTSPLDETSSDVVMTENPNSFSKNSVPPLSDTPLPEAESSSTRGLGLENRFDTLTLDITNTPVSLKSPDITESIKNGRHSKIPESINESLASLRLQGLPETDRISKTLSTDELPKTPEAHTFSGNPDIDKMMRSNERANTPGLLKSDGIPKGLGPKTKSDEAVVSSDPQAPRNLDHEMIKYGDELGSEWDLPTDEELESPKPLGRAVAKSKQSAASDTSSVNLRRQGKTLKYIGEGISPSNWEMRDRLTTDEMTDLVEKVVESDYELDFDVFDNIEPSLSESSIGKSFPQSVKNRQEKTGKSLASEAETLHKMDPPRLGLKGNDQISGAGPSKENFKQKATMDRVSQMSPVPEEKVASHKSRPKSRDQETPTRDGRPDRNPKHRGGRNRGRKRKNRTRTHSSTKNQKVAVACCAPGGAGSLRKRDCIPCPPEVKSRPRPQLDPAKTEKNAAMSKSKPDDMAKGANLQQLADRKAAAEFRNLARKLKLPIKTDEVSLAILRARFKQSSQGLGNFMQRWGPLTFFGATALPLYVTNLVKTIQNGASKDATYNAAVSIIPIAGCSSQLLTDLKYNRQSVAASTANVLCFAGDFLLFTPWLPIGIALHAIRGAFTSLELLSKEVMLSRRDTAWGQHYQEMLRQSQSQDSIHKVKLWYTEEIANITFQVSEERGMLAAAQSLSQSTIDTTKQPEAEAIISEQYNKTEQTLCASIRDRRLRVLMALPNTKWVDDQAAKFQNSFMKNYEDEAEERHLMTPEKYSFVAHGMPVFDSSLLRSSERRRYEALVSPIRRYLHSNNLDTKKFEFVKQIRSHFNSVLFVPSQCSCPTNVNELETIKALEVNGDELEHALRCSAANGNADMVQKILALGTNINVKSKNGNTPLMLAAMHGHKDAVEKLLGLSKDVFANVLRKTNSIDLNVRNNKGQTAQALAKKNGHDKVLKILKKAAGK
ncbi:hypothetical protein CDD81_1755 [Ophiocordyceps australis]|uniref:Uncharacterized protein n=1 Tax=Ophiocordyceps australis TaxID=1399860 RepID=A0A2C5XB62_9HYPO|nr:hypothetical protein CDD81_1755 [Ophiocordyceps australis]